MDDRDGHRSPSPFPHTAVRLFPPSNNRAQLVVRSGTKWYSNAEHPEGLTSYLFNPTQSYYMHVSTIPPPGQFQKQDIYGKGAAEEVTGDELRKRQGFELIRKEEPSRSVAPWGIRYP